MYAEVIIDISHSNVDRVFEYKIPEAHASKMKVGARILVPFGNNRTPVEGYIIAIKDKAHFPLEKIKEAIEPLDEIPAIILNLVQLAIWMKKKYHCLLVDGLRVMIPSQMRGQQVHAKKIKFIRLLVTENQRDDVYRSIRKNANNQRQLLDYLFDFPYVSITQIKITYPYAASCIKSFIEKKWVVIQEETIRREPYHELNDQSLSVFHLTQEQKSAVDTICTAFYTGVQPYLLHGVTGSGKTEVYMRSIQYILDRLKSAIVLVPEISLTPQMVQRFRNRFGNQVAVLHSRLSSGERFDEWSRIRNGSANVVVGARSAIFAPLSNIGLIIIDEEHEQSYRSDTNPRYDTYEIAQYRCNQDNAILLLGSATPSITSYFKAKNNELTILNLLKRVQDRPLPIIEIIDMREELLNGNRSIFSKKLYEQIERCLSSDEQIILFINRRGYSTFVSCRECGYVMTCKTCSVSLTYHQSDNIMKCHYCNMTYSIPLQCPECKSRYIKYFGTGTQKVEEEVKKLFSNARIIRMDNDTTNSKKDAHLHLLQDFKQKKANILIGTQMIAKGLDFPNVTLVGVITADTMLNIPDYRSAEKTFQLITQVAGRTGRDKKLGKVIVQTYTPNHYSIMMAAKYDYLGFYEMEIANRYNGQYPPYVRLLKILVYGENEKNVEKDCIQLQNNLNDYIRSKTNWMELIPFCHSSQAPLNKIKCNYRWHILIKIRETALTDTIIDELYLYMGNYKILNSSILIEVNPNNML